MKNKENSMEKEIERIKENEERYNEVPYTSKAYSTTQPINQKINLGILGLETPKLKTARVLEIGCSFGGNIIPFALSNPEAEVVGIDLSEFQINEGKKFVEKLGLNNLKLYAMNILDYNNEFGKFDYIICHGVFSWVPEIVQDKILEVIKKGLIPNGSAVVSYNTYPGWKRLDILRDIMIFRNDMLESQGVEVDKNNVVQYGRGAIEFLKNHSFLEERLKKDAEEISKKSDYYIYHEFFEMENRPLYLYNFNKELVKNGLIHICDSYIRKSFPPIFHTPWYRDLQIECEDDYVAREQYYDYIYNTQFRTSIITHLENKHNFDIVNSEIKINDLSKFHIRGKFVYDVEEGCYKGNREGSILKGLDNNLIGYINSAYPNTVSISEIIEKFSDSLIDLPSLIFDKHVEIFENEVIVEIPEKIKISEKYRTYLKTYLETEIPIVGFASPLGYELALSKAEMSILLKFDGTKTKKELVEDIMSAIENGEFALQRSEGEERATEVIVEEIINKLIEIVYMNGIN